VKSGNGCAQFAIGQLGAGNSLLIRFGGAAVPRHVSALSAGIDHRAERGAELHGEGAVRACVNLLAGSGVAYPFNESVAGESGAVGGLDAARQEHDQIAGGTNVRWIQRIRVRADWSRGRTGRRIRGRRRRWLLREGNRRQKREGECQFGDQFRETANTRIHVPGPGRDGRLSWSVWIGVSQVNVNWLNRREMEM